MSFSIHFTLFECDHSVHLILCVGHAGQIDASEVQSALSALKISASTETIAQELAEYDEDHNGSLDFNEFCKFLDKLQSADQPVATYSSDPHLRRPSHTQQATLAMFEEEMNSSMSARESVRA